MSAERHRTAESFAALHRDFHSDWQSDCVGCLVIDLVDEVVDDQAATAIQLGRYSGACNTVAREIQRVENEEPDLPGVALGLRTALAMLLDAGPWKSENVAVLVEEALVAHFNGDGPLFGTEHSVGCIRNVILAALEVA